MHSSSPPVALPAEIHSGEAGLSVPPWLYVTDAKFAGIGIDLVAEQQIRALSEGTAVDVVARGNLTLPRTRVYRHPVPPTKLLSWLPSQQYYALNKRYFSWLGRRQLAAGVYTGVVAWSRTALRLFEAAERRGIPRILNVGNHYRSGVASPDERWPLIPRARYLAEYELATRILVASRQAAESFVAHGVPAEKLRIVYRGVDTQHFRPPAARPARPFIVASCGLLGERKGTHQLLRAWRRAALPADAELWLIGHLPPAEESSIRLLMSPGVRLLGFRRDLSALLPQVHLHVLLSRNEGLAKVLLEAASSGVPNLCTAAGGLPGDFPGTWWVSDREDEDGVARVMEAAYRDPGLAWQAGLAARQAVVERFGWAAFRQRFLMALEGAAGGEACQPVFPSPGFSFATMPGGVP